MVKSRRRFSHVGMLSHIATRGCVPGRGGHSPPSATGVRGEGPLVPGEAGVSDFKAACVGILGRAGPGGGPGSAYSAYSAAPPAPPPAVAAVAALPAHAVVVIAAAPVAPTPILFNLT